MHKTVLNVASVVLALALAACQNGSDNGVQASTSAANASGVLKTDAVDLSASTSEQVSFLRHYRLDPIDINLHAGQYALPLAVSDIANYGDFAEKVPLSNQAIQRVQGNGFVVIDYPYSTAEDDIVAPYKALKERGIPIFVTTDSLLHLYHIQFDETLRGIEERELSPTAWAMAKGLFDASLQTYKTSTGTAQEAARRNVGYFAVALRLLRPDAVLDIPSAVKAAVDAEIDHVMQHKGYTNSPLFLYQEDYSQYVPRGTIRVARPCKTTSAPSCGWAGSPSCSSRT